MQEKPNQRVLLIGLHNEKALGVRYLANAAEAAGYEAHILFFKGFNSETPEPATENELRLLREEAARDRAVRECDFVMRGEGEVTICEVLDCLA